MNTKSLVMNNVVPEKDMRKIQRSTLKELAEILSHSFGPNGSVTCIKQDGAESRYTKDGHTILGQIHYNGIIEQSVKDDIESITRHIVKTVGDGTTSAVLLSHIIFENIMKAKEEHNFAPLDCVRALEKVANLISNKIMENKEDLTLDSVYDIAMISTNGNEELSNILRQIYEKFGNGVHIDVTPSTGTEFVLKEYDGMVLNTGYSDGCYITNTNNNSCEISHPEVYFFEHPIDTRELGVYLDAIISSNIIKPTNEGAESGDYSNVVPTVIFAPKISQDVSSSIENLVSAMTHMPVQNRLPICIVTGYREEAELNDLMRLCGAKPIRKYIDPKIFEEDVKAGRAPVPETIKYWSGKCDAFRAYSDKSVFIRPSQMYNEDGSYSNIYNHLVSFLETEIDRAIKDGENIREVGRLKRRLYSLQSSMVELFVGGITQADRDSKRDLLEDAVLNVRSAAKNGVGLGANMSTARTFLYTTEEFIVDDGTALSLMHKALYDAYRVVTTKLFYDNIEDPDFDFTRDKEGHSLFAHMSIMAKDNKVWNIREKNWNTNVKSSIMSDITILKTVCQIVSIMAACNQFIVPTPAHNIYINNKE